MGENSHIEWTDHTFNPWIGCTKVSPGCENCYAEVLSHRRVWALWGKGKPRTRTSPTTWKSPFKWNEEAMKSQRRRRVFCASLSDVFDAEVDPGWRTDLWEIVRTTPYLDWLILTKRPENIVKMLPSDWGDGWRNVCLMTSVEDQVRAERIAQLIKIPAQFRALSIEPLLGPVELAPEWMQHLDWVIVGGESGHGARPIHPEWVQALQRQCFDHEVKFFFKQWGCWSPDETFANSEWTNVAYFDSPSSKPVFLKKLGREERKDIRSNPGGKLFLFHAFKEETGNLMDGKRYLAHPFGKRIPRSEIVQSLSTIEKRELDRCEKTIRKGLQNFVEVGTALMEIRKGRLYRETHATFEDYVQFVLSLSRPHAYNLMDGAQVMHDLSSIEDIPLPTNEAQARELKYLKTPEERSEKWREVVATVQGQPLTVKLIRGVVRPRAFKEPANRTMDGFQTCIAKLEAFVEKAGVSDDAIPLIRCVRELVERKGFGDSDQNMT